MSVKEDKEILIRSDGMTDEYIVERNNVKLIRKKVKIDKKNIYVQQQIHNEIDILKKIRDRNVIIYKDSIIDEHNNEISLFTEYFENNLDQIIDKNKNDLKDFSESV